MSLELMSSCPKKLKKSLEFCPKKKELCVNLKGISVNSFKCDTDQKPFFI